MNNPGRPSQEETERNMALYHDWKIMKAQELPSYAIMADLMTKYQISAARIWKIIAKEKVKEERKDIP